MEIDNNAISDILELTGKLLELKGENPFKTRAYAIASDIVYKSEYTMQSLYSSGLLGTLEGIGSGMQQNIKEIIETGTLPQLEQLLQEIPSGVIEILNIKGIGPKKTAVLWLQLGITTPGELLYACNENRLVTLKGFGTKTQDSIRKALEFTIGNANRFRYNTAWDEAEKILKQLNGIFRNNRISLCGDLYCFENFIEKIEILIESNIADSNAIISKSVLQDIEVKDQIITGKSERNIPVEITFTQQFELDLGIKSTPEDVSAQLTPSNLSTLLNYHPERWHVTEILNLPKEDLIFQEQLKGVIHTHSTWSDGGDELSKLAAYCKNKGFEYLLISDHSKSATYANGLSEGRVEAQHLEIDKLNKELAPFRIFKGIESDILSDGSLDYSDEILKNFEIVIASIHSNLKMEMDQATKRLIRAIENPFTRILGHPTGRLLLSREGYPIDHYKIIDACAANNVAIELNASPYRLDIDWSFIPYCMEKGVLISINPDAHMLKSIDDHFYGSKAARKGGLTVNMTLNSKSKEEIISWINSK